MNIDMEIVYRWSVPVLWIFFWSYWGLSSLHTGKTEYAESKISRLFHLGMIGSAFAVVAFDRFHTGPLAWSILPESRLVLLTGTIITALGLAFAVWARMQLGINWSGAIAMKADQQLIQTGPYAIVRHPIYTGIVMGVLGTAIAIDGLRGILAIVLIFIAYFRKIWIEEKWLVNQFGSEYIQYQLKVKALIPFIL